MNVHGSRERGREREKERERERERESGHDSATPAAFTQVRNQCVCVCVCVCKCRQSYSYNFKSPSQRSFVPMNPSLLLLVKSGFLLVRLAALVGHRDGQSSFTGQTLVYNRQIGIT